MLIWIFGLVVFYCSLQHILRVAFDSDDNADESNVSKNQKKLYQLTVYNVVSDEFCS